MLNAVFEQRCDGVWGESCEATWRRSGLGRGEDAGPEAAQS